MEAYSIELYTENQVKTYKIEVITKNFIAALERASLFAESREESANYIKINLNKNRNQVVTFYATNGRELYKHSYSNIIRPNSKIDIPFCYDNNIFIHQKHVKKILALKKSKSKFLTVSIKKGGSGYLYVIGDGVSVSCFSVPLNPLRLDYDNLLVECRVDHITNPAQGFTLNVDSLARITKAMKGYDLRFYFGEKPTSPVYIATDDNACHILMTTCV